MTSGFEYINRYYAVTARLGGRVRAYGKLGTITGYIESYLLIRMDGDDHSMPYHPAWEIEYLD